MKLRFSVLQTQSGYDFVTIYDGSNEQSTQIENISGNIGGFIISSSGNSLFVKFVSNSHTYFGGFLAIIHYGNPYLKMK